VSRRRFLSGLGCAAAAAALPRSTSAADRVRRPNILFILADDLGYADLSCYGRRDYRTPVLDELAADGMRFTQAYANSCVCSPTRVALATGRYQYRLAAGLEEPIGALGLVAGEASGLPPLHPTSASLLRAAGYRTALIGKWHLGEPPNFGPLQSGYDQFFGIAGGGVDYVSHTAPGPGLPDLYDGEKLVSVEGYLTDLLSDKAVEFVKASKRADKPFFLSLHYTAPHWPWQAPGDSAMPKERVLFDLEGGSLEVYARIMKSLDSGIGRVLKSLREAGVDRNTLVVFTSDNGGERFSDNWPFTGQKMDLLEGGIRVPLIARWRDGIRGGTTSGQVAISMDWVPTLLALGGSAPDPSFPSDGIDLSSVLRGGKEIGPRALYWRMLYRQQAAIRSGDWKYLRIGENEFLFDLAADARERANRRRYEPQRFADLKARFEQWNASMLPLPQSQRPYFNERDLAGYHN
jgi:arylsulfatase A-like enzyme